VQPTPTSAVVRQAVGDILTDAQTQYDAGKWTDAISRLEQLKSLDASFQPDKVQALLYDAYVQNGNSLLEEQSPEEALRSFDSALAMKADDTQIQDKQALIKQYLTALGYSGSNPEKAVEAFAELFQTQPDFLDVKNRTYEAYSSYAEFLVQGENWCDAAQQYARALEIRADAKVKATAGEVEQKCQTNPTREKPLAALTPGATVTATVTLSRPRPSVTAKATAGPLPQATKPISPTKGTATPPASPPPAALSGIIAYSAKDPDQKQRIYVVQPGQDKAEPAILLQDATQPSFSQDGQRLAVHSLRSDLGGIRVSDLGGDGGVIVTKFIEDGFPSWSPDGTQVVLASTRESDRRSRIFITWTGGLSDGTQLTLGESPAWSPKGTIAYHGCDPSGGNCGIWVMNPDGGNKTQATNHESDTAPAWSPDGGQLALMSARDGNWEIYTANADGSQVKRLTTNSTNDGLPVWSPDGKWIAFVSDRGGEWELYVIPSGGGDARKVAAVPNVAYNWQEQRLAWRK
jgi:tetratricopeptide (TPR) repeat protein